MIIFYRVALVNLIKNWFGKKYHLQTHNLLRSNTQVYSYINNKDIKLWDRLTFNNCPGCGNQHNHIIQIGKIEDDIILMCEGCGVKYWVSLKRELGAHEFNLNGQTCNCNRS